MRNPAILALTGLSFVGLTACNSGGGNARVDEMPEETIVVNSMTASDVLVSYRGQRERIQTHCSGDTCTFSYGGLAESIDVDDLIAATPGGSPAIQQSGNLNGVALYSTSDSYNLEGNQARLYGYGGWLNESAFAVGILEVTGGEASGVRAMLSASVGYAPGTNPSETDGGGTWTGAMRGVHTHSAEILQGAATVDIDDFSNPDVDVSFAHIEYVGSGARHADMGCDDIPVTGGSFSTGYDGKLHRWPILWRHPSRSWRSVRAAVGARRLRGEQKLSQ